MESENEELVLEVDDEDDIDSDEADEDSTETFDTKIIKRAKKILTNVWKHLHTRMQMKTTSKSEFFATNMNKARQLAIKEFIDHENNNELVKV